jgi:general secretion pathway protein C
VEVLLKKRMWLVTLAVVGTCAALAGRAAAHLLEAELLDQMPIRHQTVALAVAPPHGKDPTALVERNIFCSGCMTPKAKAAAEEAAEEAKREPQKTGLPLALLGVLLAGDEAMSRAVVRDLSTPQKDAALFGPGSELFATHATIEHVYGRRVYLRNGRELEYLDLDEKLAPPKNAPPPPAPRSAAPDPLLAALDQGLSCGGGHCQIERSLVEQALRNTAMLATSARFVPAMRDGHPLGFRVFAIRPGSLFARLGLSNGDTIRAINGNDMSTPDQALALYSKLRNASHLSLELDRQGGRITMDYVIH